MKKILLISLMMFLSACTQKQVEKDLVVTTMYPIYDITQIIASEAVNVHNIAPLSMEVHDYEPSAQDIIMLEKASLFIVHGSGIEGWLESTLQNIQNDQLKVIVLSDHVQLINDDPHTWLSINYMKTYSELILEGLTDTFPNHEVHFKQAHSNWSQDADKLVFKYQDMFNNRKIQDIVVDHLAYTYLAHDLNLNQVSITGGILASDISAKQLKSMVDYIKKEQPQVIYKDEISSDQLFQVLKEETGIHWEILYTLERMNPNEYKSYLEMMDLNLGAIEKGLAYDPIQ